LTESVERHAAVSLRGRDKCYNIINIFLRELWWLTRCLFRCLLLALAGILNLAMRDLKLICNLLIGKASISEGKNMNSIITAKATPLLSCLLRGGARFGGRHGVDCSLGSLRYKVLLTSYNTN
jgi:hypothetical protein